MHKAAARLAGDIDHPAAFAGCFVHLRAGDAVWPEKYQAAAQLVASLNKTQVPSVAMTPRSFAEVAAMAQTLKEDASGATLVAILRERELLADDAIAVGRKMERLHLPVVLMTFGRAMPKPGDPQKRLGIPEIFVAADDAVAVYRVAEESFWRARTGVGPTWMRCVTA